MFPYRGNPKFNKCPNDIDYQIEADYSGLIAPGLANVAVAMGGKFGRLMNYGDGMYAGQFMGAMYAEAFFEKDLVKVIEAGSFTDAAARLDTPRSHVSRVIAQLEAELGVVLLEALHNRVPVVASRTGGITDIIDHDRTGVLVAPGDDAALAQALAADRPVLIEARVAPGGSARRAGLLAAMARAAEAAVGA